MSDGDRPAGSRYAALGSGGRFLQLDLVPG
jgi:hypothetical protein